MLWLISFIRVAQEKSATSAQIALAWVLAQKSWIVPIPGTTKTYRLTENAGAAEVSLTDEEVSALAETLDHIKVAGRRIKRTSKDY